MNCPRCGHDLGTGALPVRCPSCGMNFSNKSGMPSVLEEAHRTAERRDASVRSSSAGTGWNDGLHVTKGVAIFIVTTIVVVVALLGYRAEIWGGTSYPNVVGYRGDSAQNYLESAGFSVKMVEEKSDSDSGVVLSQTPAGPGRASKSTTFTLVVSSLRTMPNLVGGTVDQAKAALDAQSIAYEIQEQGSDAAAGTVLATSVAAGSHPLSTDKVIVAVARPYEVPSVVSLSADDARKAIEGEGLVPTSVPVEPQAGVSYGTVVAVEPAAGTSVAKGSEVSISVTKPSTTDLDTLTRKILKVVYDCDPIAGNEYPIGANLRQYLSSDVTVTSSRTGSKIAVSKASDFEVWYGVVKRWSSFPYSAGDVRQSLQRAIVAVNSVDVSSDGVVTANITVRWTLERLGLRYAGQASDDTRTVRLTFDDEGKLTVFRDWISDVPSSYS